MHTGNFKAYRIRINLELGNGFRCSIVFVTSIPVYIRLPYEVPKQNLMCYVLVVVSANYKHLMISIQGIVR